MKIHTYEDHFSVIGNHLRSSPRSPLAEWSTQASPVSVSTFTSRL
ncbi:MAG: DUF3905 domain-containing protein [Verrucomicrobia bacterium]|nr:DUF3905 domain-containing protein [Verrucomicrobiota bacterium]